ncbi:hypothetical protein QBC46DRAFT_84908 [Diplogelasinospora grovesii]|uniref:PNPLA domain-containing protein n=1 Tax=Diplogelasinospora grovesii TaxID=303347 RepID=A0AAN6ND76_9PEZI|nr:hypothetical protein QBC46DRAFT_84908 [Diplogelasinospora grovesii]
MEQTTASHQATGGTPPNPIDREGLCLLSLDGGGVRGLSTLYILKGIMARLNYQRTKEMGLPPVKPCEIFDLIGGTSTGGLIAIMLGRLEMDVDDCISQYTSLMKSVFDKQSRMLPLSLPWGDIEARFDSAKLKSAIERVITDAGASATDLFNDGKTRGCRVFVCTVPTKLYGVVRLRSYDLPGDPKIIEPTILQAALATSAATSFFDPVDIGAIQFVDGALGANNPVEHVEREASDIWCPDTGHLMPLVKCFLSVGTGHLGKKALADKLFKFLSRTLPAIVTETEETEGRFIARWRKLYDEKRYLRFNVDHGLEGVGLAEFKEQGTIDMATESYLDHQSQKFRVRDCVINLKQKQFVTPIAFAAVVDEYAIRLHDSKTAIREACWTVPFIRNVRFVGRVKLLDKLEAALFASNQPESKISLFGLGGAGKTQVALELAYRTRAKYPRCSIIWVPANNIESLRHAYKNAAKKLGIPVVDDKTDVVRLVQQHLSQDSAGQWLLIYDNVDDLDGWTQCAAGGQDEQPPRMIDCVPSSSQGCVIFTSRSRKVADKLSSQGVMHEVPQMDDDTAIKLLFSIALSPEQIPSDSQKDVASRLVTQLCHLPLGIVQAASYIRANDISFEEYVSLMGPQEEEVIELLSEDFEDDGRPYGSGANPVAKTWLISFEKIRQTDQLAADFFSLMCCFDSRDIPKSLLPPAKSPKKMVDAIGTLSAYSFINRRSTSGAESFDIHRLVHLAMRNWLRKRDSLEEWVQKAISRLDDVFSGDDEENRALWRTYMPHARFALDSWSPEAGWEQGTELMDRVSVWLIGDVRFDDAEKYYSRCVEILKKELGENDPKTLETMRRLFLTYELLGRPDAEKSLTLLVETCETKLGKHHPETLRSMKALAGTYTMPSRLEQAEELYKRVIKAQTERFGEKDVATLDTMVDLAKVYTKQGRPKEAEEYLVKVGKVYSEQPRDERHHFILGVNRQLALAIQGQGRLEEAEKIFTQVLETSKKTLGEEHLITLNTMDDLAHMYGKGGRFEEAEKLLIQVVETSKKTFGEEHLITLNTMDDLAHMYQGQDRFEEAEKLFIQVLLLRTRKLGEDHLHTLGTMQKLWKVYWRQDRFKEAEKLFAKVLDTYKTKYGEDHYTTLEGMGILALTWKAQGRHQEAMDMMEDCYQRSRQALGADHKHTLDAKEALDEWRLEFDENLGEAYWSQGRFNEAEELFAKVLDTYKTKYGEDHYTTLASMGILALTWKAQGRYQEAMDMMEDCYQRSRQALGADHRRTLKAKEALDEWRLEPSQSGTSSQPSRTA